MITRPIVDWTGFFIKGVKKMNVNELDNLSYEELKNLYILLNNFNSYPKDLRKEIIKQLKQKMEEKE